MILGNNQRIVRRQKFLGANVPTFYSDPLHIVRGEGVWLWDAAGNKYLDCYNNVPHVGHCHPKVVEAISAAAGTLNTHTRYLHDGILDYAEALTGRLGHGLETLIMVCTGSEANDIALRMGQAVTGKTGIISTDNTYHGNTALVSQLSSKKPPIGGVAPNIRRVPAPEQLAPLGGSAEAQAPAFAEHVAQAIAELEAAGHGFATLILCPFFANEGFPSLTKGFLTPVAEVVRKAGGIIVADEVQPGYGRLGSHFWGHDWIGLVPDVVTVGKPMANGHPVGAVITRPEVLQAFQGTFSYFNTFGGNPVSCAAAMATLEVVEDEGLQENARDVGAYALDRLRALRHPHIKNVRGQGLFMGVEFADDALAPLPAFTANVVEAMRRNGVLVNKVGRACSCLKIRPPMPLSRANADLLVDTLERVLSEVPA